MAFGFFRASLSERDKIIRKKIDQGRRKAQETTLAFG